MKRADWDRLADEFETETCDITREESADQMERFVALARPARVKPALVDLGCGVGTFIHRFGGGFARVIGVEFAPRIMARAKARCVALTGTTWLTMDVARAGDAIGRKADLTVCLNVITQSAPTRRAALWSSVAAVTKRGGYALLVVPSLESECMVAEAGGDSNRRTGGLVERDGAWQKHYERGELETIFARLGFTAARIEPAPYPWSVEGMRQTKSRRDRRPWDWICLARKI